MILRNLGIIASIRGHYDLAIARFHESYNRAREIGDDDGQCRALNNVATAYLDMGRYADAEKTYGSAIRIARRRGDRGVECGCRINLCEALIGSGKLADAEVECMAALGIADWRGDRVRRAEGLKVLAIIARHRGRDDEALSLLDEAFELSAGGDDAVFAAQLRREKAEVYRHKKQTAQAAKLFREARDIYKRVGASGNVASIDRLIAGLSAAGSTAS
jgi:tetratricopeptide (TPR) repeat protein